MKSALIVTLGFDEKFCYRAILRNEIKDGDTIILLTAGVVDKVKRAYELVERFVSTTYSDVEVKLLEVNPNDFVSGVSRVLKLLRELKDSRIIVNLSGGMRALSLMVYCALTLADKKAKIEIELEDFSGVVEIPSEILSLPRALSRLSDEKIRLLKVLKEKEVMRVKEIASVLRKDITTIRRHIYDLEVAGLVEIVRRKPLEVKVSDFARMVIS